jgi:hypothetical protein
MTSQPLISAPFLERRDRNWNSDNSSCQDTTMIEALLEHLAPHELSKKQY